jgi:hypothetical protein
MAVLFGEPPSAWKPRLAWHVHKVLELGRNKYEGPTSEFTNLEKAFWIGG